MDRGTFGTFPRTGEVGVKAMHRVTQADVRLSTRRPVRVQRVDVGGPVTAHDHDYHEIALMTAGAARHVTSREAEAIGRGDAIVVPPGEVHAFERPRGLVAANVYYLAEWVAAEPALLWSEPGLVPLFCNGSLVRRPASFGVKRVRLDAASLATVEHELATMEAELGRDAPGAGLLKACFLKVLIAIARCWRGQDPAADRGAQFRSEVWRTIERIERCVQGGRPFQLGPAARTVGLSPDHLSASFRAAVGYSPQQYYQGRRTQRACQLLADPRLSMTQIALILGYSDSSHFSRLFRARQNMSPREYRAIYAMPHPGS